MSLGSGSSGPFIELTEGVQVLGTSMSSSGGDELRDAVGQAAPNVNKVEVVLYDGTVVQASLENGFWAMWAPVNDDAPSSRTNEFFSEIRYEEAGETVSVSFDSVSPDDGMPQEVADFYDAQADNREALDKAYDAGEVSDEQYMDTQIAILEEQIEFNRKNPEPCTYVMDLSDGAYGVSTMMSCSARGIHLNDDGEIIDQNFKPISETMGEVRRGSTRIIGGTDFPYGGQIVENNGYDYDGLDQVLSQYLVNP
jgi:hypothetical protein